MSLLSMFSFGAIVVIRNRNGHKSLITPSTCRHAAALDDNNNNEEKANDDTATSQELKKVLLKNNLFIKKYLLDLDPIQFYTYQLIFTS